MTDADQNHASRRHFLKIATGTAAAAFAMGVARVTEAFGLPHLTSNDPTAKALNYVEDASQSRSTLHKPGNACAGCRFYMGGTNDYGPCQLYPGKVVSSKGWCTSYTPKAT